MDGATDVVALVVRSSAVSHDGWRPHIGCESANHLSALLSLIGRQLSTIVQAIFGWYIPALFGKLPSQKQTALSVAIGPSVAWPLLALGCFVPSAPLGRSRSSR
jgi:hypothetical protein